MLVLSLVTGNIQIHSPDRQFLPIYLLKRNQAPRRYTTSLLVQNSSGESAGDFPKVEFLFGDLGGNELMAHIRKSAVLILKASLLSGCVIICPLNKTSDLLSLSAARCKYCDGILTSAQLKVNHNR